MAQAAKKVFLLCDSSKIENDSYFTYSSLSLVNLVITDKGLDNNYLELYKNRGLNLLIAGL